MELIAQPNIAQIGILCSIDKVIYINLIKNSLYLKVYSPME